MGELFSIKSKAIKYLSVSYPQLNGPFVRGILPKRTNKMNLVDNEATQSDKSRWHEIVARYARPI